LQHDFHMSYGNMVLTVILTADYINAAVFCIDSRLHKYSRILY
jgi:hypothetical protein